MDKRERDGLTVFHGTLQVVQHAVVVHTAEHSLVHQSKLFSCRQLAFAGEAGEAGQMVGVPFGSANPVVGVDVPPAVSTAGPVFPLKNNNTFFLIPSEKNKVRKVTEAKHCRPLKGK